MRALAEQGACEWTQAPNATSNGGDASRVGVFFSSLYKLISPRQLINGCKHRKVTLFAPKCGKKTRFLRFLYKKMR